MRAGVDIGGTFTDLVVSEGGRLRVHKLPSTPSNPAAAMLAGLEEITKGDVAALSRVAHGSTVATNAILERRGAKTALITTQGFRDVLFIGRQHRPDLYALQPQMPPPLIPRELCYEVPERLDHTGETLLPLDEPALDAVLDQIAAQGVEAVAVCLLYSYVNPAHEQAIRERIVARGIAEAWQVALSSDVLPQFREYERASTVTLEAYVRPVMGRYIATLQGELWRRSQKTGLSIMKSDGGVISAARVQEQAVQTALSGPAAGVIGAVHLAKLAGFDNIITLDMGGTSTDVAVCPGELPRRPESEIDGLPLRMRLLDIETIGAGGGSLARVDAGGLLRVGPQSAGAEPGPACYARGGKRATVSDANAVLGRLVPQHFLGGQMPLDLGAAELVVGGIAGKLEIGLTAAAQGILDVANVNIDRALRRVSVARGHDPRNFTLVAFGGAGPLHACAVADGLEIPRVLVPRYPGVLCAFGLLVADVVMEYSRSVLGPVTPETTPMLADILESMIAEARDALKAEGIPRKRRHYHASLDMRYTGQAYELNVPMHGGEDLSEAFHAVHEQAYGHRLPERAVEVVNLRLQAVGTVKQPDILPEPVKTGAEPANARLGTQRTAAGMTALYDREALMPGASFAGPALVFQLDSTVYVPDGWAAQVDGYRNLVLSRR